METNATPCGNLRQNVHEAILIDEQQKGNSTHAHTLYVTRSNKIGLVAEKYTHLLYGVF